MLSRWHCTRRLPRRTLAGCHGWPIEWEGGACYSERGARLEATVRGRCSGLLCLGACIAEIQHEWLGVAVKRWGALKFHSLRNPNRAKDAHQTCLSQSVMSPPLASIISALSLGPLVLSLSAAAAPVQLLPCAAPTIVGFYNPSCDASGNLLPPAHFNYSIQAAVDASVRYYDRSPLDSHGLPSYTYATFLDGNYTPTSFDIIAGMQDGMGILGYIAYAERAKAGRGGIAEPALAAATHLATYLTLWANSASDGVWANVTRSSGYNFEWPLTTAGQG